MVKNPIHEIALNVRETKVIKVIQAGYKKRSEIEKETCLGESAVNAVLNKLHMLKLIQGKGNGIWQAIPSAKFAVAENYLDEYVEPEIKSNRQLYIDAICENPLAGITKKQLKQIKLMCDRGMTRTQIAKEIGMERLQLGLILDRNQWRAGRLDPRSR